MNVNLANSSFCFWVWLHATSIMLKGVEYFRRIFIAQDHTLQDHFCSMIDEFPVWSSETDQAAMMWIVPYSEREGATEHNAVLCRWSPDLDKEPSERCNITSPCLPQQVTCLNQMYKLYSPTHSLTHSLTHPHPGFCTLVQLLCPSVEPEPNRTLKSRPAHHPEELYLCVSWGGWADSVLRKGPQLGNWSSWGPNCWNGPHFTQKVSCSPFPKCVSLQYIHFLHEML